MPVATGNAAASSSRSAARQGSATGSLNDNGEAIVKPEYVPDQWTTATFVDQPIEKTNGNIDFIRGLQARGRDTVEKLKDSLGLISNAAVGMEQASPDDEAIDSLDADFRRVSDLLALTKLQLQALEEMATALRSNQSLVDPAKIYEDRYKMLSEEYQRKTSRQKFIKSEPYRDFRAAIWEINHSDTGCPPVSRFIPLEEGDDSDDEEIELGGATQTYRCPLTFKPFVNAVTSSMCNHSFSKAAVMNIIQQSKAARKDARCPLAGCTKPLREECLVPDANLQKRTNEAERRRAQREEGDEDEMDVLE